MEIRTTDLDGVLVIEPQVFGDERGFFMESWSRQRYLDAGVVGEFVQDNMSRSGAGVLRGLHFQYPKVQGKLVQVLEGTVFDVAVDIRRGSPTFGRWVGVELDAGSKRQFWIPPGFAHGFCVLGESAVFAYKCTDYYDPVGDYSILFDDPDIGIEWPIESPQVSGKDAGGMRLSEVPESILPPYPGGRPSEH